MLEPDHDNIKKPIQREAHSHCDETHWTMRGKRGVALIASTPKYCLVEITNSRNIDHL